ncbi:MAG: hypothetical protein WDN00_04090 [Limisphaerales bacterium]
MSILLKVQWVDQAEQADPCQRIKQIGGNSRSLEWKHSQAEAIRAIEHGHFTYYVKKAAQALKLEVGMANNGRKFLKIPDEAYQPLESSLPKITRSANEVQLHA